MVDSSAGSEEDVHHAYMTAVVKPLLKLDAVPLVLGIIPLKCVQHFQLHHQQVWSPEVCNDADHAPQANMVG